MSVIINNLDMMVQRQEEATPNQSAKPDQPTATGQPSQDIRDTLRHQAERRARLRAY